MPLNAEQQQSLLAQRGVGATVLTRLQQMGLDDIAKLAAADVDDILQQGAVLSGSTCCAQQPRKPVPPCKPPLPGRNNASAFQTTINLPHAV